MTGDRGWVEFYDYLSQLEPHTKFRSAIARDPEMAKMQVSALSDDQVREIMEQEEQEEPDLTPEGHTLLIEKLNQILDKISILTLTMSMSKEKRFKPTPRPKTEVRKLLEERMDKIDRMDQISFEKELGF